MKFAIVGYGNLGKSLARLIENGDDELVAVYSRRNIDLNKSRALKQIDKDGDFDVALNCMGSFGDCWQYADLLAPLDTVDSFDTHAKITDYKNMLTALNPKRIAVTGAGWDPGLLSLLRGTVSAGGDVATVWGKGISQGHSNAVRAIDGVIDAVQFTVPKQNWKNTVDSGNTDGAALHDRICYVACVEADKESVRQQIVNMPNYFKGYDTYVEFVSPAEVRRLKQNTSHCGQIYFKGKGYTAQAELSLECNTDLTAQIMLRYAHALPRLKADGYAGALDVFDIPLKYITQNRFI